MQRCCKTCGLMKRRGGVDGCTMTGKWRPFWVRLDSFAGSRCPHWREPRPADGLVAAVRAKREEAQKGGAG